MALTPLHRMARLPTSILASAGLALAWAPPAAAQVMEGRVLDARTEDPVAQAYIALVTEDRESVMAATADRDGAFSIEAPFPGSYFLYVSAVGYRPAADGLYELGADGRIELEIRLEPDPVLLDSIRATVERTDRYLREVGFYERRKRGWGHHLDHEEVQEHAVVTVTDALRDLAGVYVVGDLPYPSVVIRRGGGRPCAPHVFVDGFLVRGSQGGGAKPDQFVHPDDVAAIEVYRSSTEAPMQYAPVNACAVLLIWTWHG